MKPERYFPQLLAHGIAWDDAWALRLIAKRLHRWHELECGTDSGAIERDETTGKAYWVNSMTGSRYPARDMETGALKRLAKILERYPSLSYYVQGDPRGAPIYILRPDDVPPGASVDAYYSRGIAVY